MVSPKKLFSGPYEDVYDRMSYLGKIPFGLK